MKQSMSPLSISFQSYIIIASSDLFQVLNSPEGNFKEPQDYINKCN